MQRLPLAIRREQCRRRWVPAGNLAGCSSIESLSSTDSDADSRSSSGRQTGCQRAATAEILVPRRPAVVPLFVAIRSHALSPAANHGVPCRPLRRTLYVVVRGSAREPAAPVQPKASSTTPHGTAGSRSLPHEHGSIVVGRRAAPFVFERHPTPVASPHGVDFANESHVSLATSTLRRSGVSSSTPTTSSCNRRPA